MVARPKLAHLARTYKRDARGRFARTSSAGSDTAAILGRRKEGRHRAGRTPHEYEQAEQRLRAVYGDRLRVKDRDDPAVQKALIDLDAMPEDHKRRLARHFAGVEGGGLLIAKGRAIDVYKAHGRQDLIDQVWGHRDGQIALGMYTSRTRVAAIGTIDGGGASTAQHEAAHALDHALGWPSQNRKLPVWPAVKQARWHDILHWYFAQEHGKGQQESFAEGYVQWNKHRDDPNRNRKIAEGLGAPNGKTGYDAEVERLGRRLSEFFDTLV
ncbi:hypothetical protein [Frankia sp. AgB32]|uniref:hypothetical protein n=1 Tax=Frankia sp. AgB32 TaxID=631119 RepID=UPI00200C4444|nr:hypothetical protein [Frankia sp. AgB32]MCK9896958.1 hypothetical protein [Frankia sp. AgB32]